MPVRLPDFREELLKRFNYHALVYNISDFRRSSSEIIYFSVDKDFIITIFVTEKIKY